jgi:hypothetical protein
MNSNANSNAAEPSRYVTGRAARTIGGLIRRIGRYIFSRRMVWAVAMLASLLGLIHQYENWHATRELASARAGVLARIGTENLMDILPEVVPEEENFFAVPIIKSWRKSNPMGVGVFEYVFPAEQLLPVGFPSPVVLRDTGDMHLDLAGWVQQRTATGRPLTAGQSPASALQSDLAGHREIITLLIAGLDRPGSQIIPCRRASLLQANGNPNEAGLPLLTGAMRLQNNLAIHLLASAVVGDAEKTRGIAGVMLTLAEGCANDPNLVPLLLGMALYQEALGALSEALHCGTLTDADFNEIQRWLAKTNDVKAAERTSFGTLLASATVFDRFKTQVGHRAAFGPDFDAGCFMGTLIAPIGWVDSNRAFASKMMLLMSGMGGAETWRSGDAGRMEVASLMQQKSGGANPRQLLGRIAIPGISGMWVNSAQNLFKRRCAILTCGLHRHRLLHGSYPAHLTELDASLLPGPQPDPARADAPLNYRLTEKGFLLWSVGLDRVDDGGDPEKDWIWRHEI